MAPQDTGRFWTPGRALGTPVGPLGTPDGLPPSTAGPAPLKPRVRPSFYQGPFRPFWVSGDRLRSPLTPRRRLPHAEHPGRGLRLCRLLPWGLTAGSSLRSLVDWVPHPLSPQRSLSPPVYCFLLVSGLSYFAQKLRFSLGILIVVYHFPLPQ